MREALGIAAGAEGRDGVSVDSEALAKTCEQRPRVRLEGLEVNAGKGQASTD